MDRRTFLKVAGAGLLARPLFVPGADWDHEMPVVAQMRQYLEPIFAGRSMALDFRRINAQQDEEFRIQLNASDRYPVASCFKAWSALYYFYYTPSDTWYFGEGSPLYSSVVFSNNTATATVLAEVAGRVRGQGNAIMKFNDFLLDKVGMSNGLYAWNWPDSATAEMVDARFAPSSDRQVFVSGQGYNVDNAFTAADLGRGYDVLMRGETFAVSDRMREAIHATKALLSIPAEGFPSPIESIFPDGYIGKDGALPVDQSSVGRVLADAGALPVGDALYIVAFMAAGESDTRALNALRDVVSQINVYEASL